MGGAFCVDTADVCGVVEYTEALAFEHIHELDKLHVEAEVGLVAAVVFHRIGPCHALPWLIELNAEHLLEKMLCHAFEELDDVVLFDEAHLAVNLSELGLTVGPEVFVAEALDYLEVTVHARHHKELLESLG